MSDELHRLHTNGLEDEPVGPLIGVVVSASDAAASLERVKEVIRLVAASASIWPTDDEWLQALPAWFIEPFGGRTIEEVLGDDTLWDFGSWLDAMRQRGWQWWSSTCEGTQWSAILSRHEDVYSIEPLIYLARQSGASSVEVTEDTIWTR
jgi:hypothetical protein